MAGEIAAAELVADIERHNVKAGGIHAEAWRRPAPGLEDAARSLVVQLAEYVHHRAGTATGLQLIELHTAAAHLQYHLDEDHGRLRGDVLARSVDLIRVHLVKALESLQRGAGQ